MANPIIIGGRLTATGTGAVGIYCSGDTTIAHVDSITATTSIEVGAGATASVIGNQFDPTATAGTGTVEYQYGDRSAWDALNYQARHANDIDAPAGIHHSAAYLGSIFIEDALANGSIFIGGSDGATHPQSIHGDASLANDGTLTLTTVNADVGVYGDATHYAQITVNAKGLITAIGEIEFSSAEVLMADGITPPDPLTTEDQTDWLYEG